MCMPASEHSVNRFYTTITACQAGLSPAYKEVIDTASQTITISMVNLSLVEMYLRALNKIGLPPAYQVLETPGENKLTGEQAANGHWELEIPFCYESVKPITLYVHNRRQQIIDDLNACFELDGRMELRPMECLVLQKAATAPGQPGEAAGGMTLYQLVHALNRSRYGVPVLDETNTGINRPTGITWSLMADLPALKKKLAQSGFSLEKATRVVEVFVLGNAKAGKVQA